VIAAIPLDNASDQLAREVVLASVECRDPLIEELFRFAVTLRERAPRPLDVRASAIVSALQKDHARPHIDGLVVVSREIVVKA
jgi:hypothetical protein